MSIKTLTYSNFEVVIVDDGSEDNSFAICEELISDDSRFRLFRKENGGVSSARNYGLEQAKGEYICWVDADDEITKDYVCDLINDLNESQDADLVIHGVRRVEKDCQSDSFCINNGIYNLESSPEAFWKALHVTDLGVPFSKLFRKSIIDEYNLRYNEQMALAEDLDFFLHYIIHAKHVVAANSANYNYKIRSASLSTSIKHPEQELMCLQQLSLSWDKICSHFPFESTKKLSGQSTSVLLHRTIVSAYTHKTPRSQRRALFNSITPVQISQYKQNGDKSSPFLAIANWLFCNRCFCLLDVLMQLVY